MNDGATKDDDLGAFISTPFWVMGLIVALFGLVGASIGIVPAPELTNLHNIWTEYLALGLLFPPLALSLTYIGNRARYVRIALIGLAAFYALCYALEVHNWIAIVFVLIAVAFSRKALSSASRESGEQRSAFILAIILAMVGGWAAASTLSYSMPLLDWMLHGSPNAAVAVLIFIVATIVVMSGMFGIDIGRGNTLSPTVMRLIDASFILLILLAACRHDLYLSDGGHVAFYVGPVEMVRQGGWLLWDVPSQYGFGNILTMAALPFRTAYTDEFALNAFLMFSSASATYFVLRSGTRALGPLFAGALAIAAMFLIGGGVCCNSLGPEHYPSIGPVRFFWCYALGSSIVGIYMLKNNERMVRLLLIIGSICWALSALWSAESAIYGSCIWFPFIAVFIVSRYHFRALTRWLLMPFLVLLAAVALIELVYWIALGHGPDWFAFIDYGLIYKNGFAANPLAIVGNVSILVLSFCILCSIALVLLKERRFAAAAVVIAACGMQWSTSSYFVMRSHPNNVLNLMAVDVFALGIALLVAGRENLPLAFLTVLRTAIAPVFIVILAISFSAPGIPSYASPLQPGSPRHLADTFVEAPPSVVALLERAGLKPDSPILYSSAYLAPVWPGNHSIGPRIWIPAYPPELIGLLTDDRAQVYLNRFVDRRPMNGYILNYTNAPPEMATYTTHVEALLANRYDRRVVQTADAIQLTHYTIRAKTAATK